MDRAADRAAWNGIFQGVPDDWFAAAPSDAMVRCLAALRHCSTRRLLDVGAGIGRWAVYLARHGIGPIVALDSAYVGTRVARQWAARERMNIRVITGDAAALPFTGESFDSILAALVLESLPHRDKHTAMAEIRRVAEPHGCVFLLFNPVLTEADIEALVASGNPTHGCHIEPCSDDQITDLLRGWDTIERGETAEGFRYVTALRPSA